jgi:iron complex transport system substrate-binding protein
VSAFTSAKIDRILDLKPDLAIGFSDMQADIARALILAGVEVWISNHRTVAGILGYVRRLGAMVGAAEKAEAYAQQLQAHVEAVRAEAACCRAGPGLLRGMGRALISAIRWVSELIGIAGGDDIFPERALAPLGASASWRIAPRSGARRTSSSAPGAARSSAPSRWPRGRVGTPCPRCATASCTRSSPR